MCTPGYSSQGKNKAKPTCLSTHSSYCSYFLYVVFVFCLSVLFSLPPSSFSFREAFSCEFLREQCMHCTPTLRFLQTTIPS